MKVVVIGNDVKDVAKWKDIWKDNGCEIINWFSSPDCSIDNPGGSWKRTIKNLSSCIEWADILFIANDADITVTPNTFALMAAGVRAMNLGQNIRTIICHIPKEGCCSKEISKYVEIGYVEMADEVLSRILPRSDVADPLIQLVS